MSTVDQTLSGEDRNWAELPPDVLTLIFEKLGHIEILFTAQTVCSSWKNHSRLPHIWRRVDMRNPWDFHDTEYDVKKMTRVAIDWSCGQMFEFCVEFYADDELLRYASERTNILRCLRLVQCYEISDEELVNVAKKFPMLEELDLCYCSFSEEALESVGRLCPNLKSLRLNCQSCRDVHIESDEEVFAIAKSMPNLRRLHLFGNSLTDEGLQMILNNCLHLEYLDLRHCFSLKFQGDLLRRCKVALKTLRLPNDSTEDYEFIAEIEGRSNYSTDDYEFTADVEDWSHDEENSSGSVFSDMDALFEHECYSEFSGGTHSPDSDF